MSIDNLKGYFEEHDDKNNTVGRVKDKDNIVGKDKKIKYLIIIFNKRTSKISVYKNIKKKLIKMLIKIMLKLNSIQIILNVFTNAFLLDTKEFI